MSAGGADTLPPHLPAPIHPPALGFAPTVPVGLPGKAVALGWSWGAKTQFKGRFPAPSPVSQQEGRAERSEKAPSCATCKREKCCLQEEGRKKPLTVLFTFLASMMKSGEVEFS